MALNRWFYTIFPGLRQIFTRRWYEFISTRVKDDTLLLMNHGYVDLDLDTESLELLPQDEQHRYSIQLYHHVANAIDWAGLDALEVGSGRGGGTAYIKRRFEPKSMQGLDLSGKAVDFCNEYHSVDSLSFTCGNAQCLPFDDNSFDVVLNVESSLLYPDVGCFLQEVVRVLRPNGYFLYTDIRYLEDIDTWRAQLEDTGLQLLKEEDITPNVVRALELDSERRRKLIARFAPKLLRHPASEFAGINGGDMAHGPPQPGERLYLNFVFRKADTPA